MEAGGLIVESGTRPEEQVRRPTAAPVPALKGVESEPVKPGTPIFEVRNLTVSYGDKPAVRDVSLDVGRNRITALIGPSGCGKSTMIRCFNRMNDLIPGARVEGSIVYHGQDVNSDAVDPV